MSTQSLLQPYLCGPGDHLSCLMTKPTKWHVRPAKTQISLGIRPVWSESSLSAWRKLGSLATHWVHSHFAGFAMRQLIFFILWNASRFYSLQLFPLLLQTLVWCKCFNMFFFHFALFHFRLLLIDLQNLQKCFEICFFAFIVVIMFQPILIGFVIHFTVTFLN